MKGTNSIDAASRVIQGVLTGIGFLAGRDRCGATSVTGSMD